MLLEETFVSGGILCQRTGVNTTGLKSRRINGILLVSICYVYHVSYFKTILLLGGGGVASAMAYWFYMSHLEVEPITGRERFSIVSPKQIQELSQLEFDAVNYSNSCVIDFNFIC